MDRGEIEIGEIVLLQKRKEMQQVVGVGSERIGRTIARMQMAHEAGDHFNFLKAEIGIRVLTVTGVQTCALPILASRPAPRAPARAVAAACPRDSPRSRPTSAAPASGAPHRARRTTGPHRAGT